MSDEGLEYPERNRKILPKIVFGLGIGLMAAAGLMFYNMDPAQRSNAPQSVAAAPGSTAPEAETPAATTASSESETGLFAMVGRLLSNSAQPDGPPRWELDQAAFPRAPDGWSLMIAQGGGQVHAVADKVYDAMHRPGEPLRVSALYDLADAQQPAGLLSEAVDNANDAMQTMGASEEEANLQTAVNPVAIQLGDSIARGNDKYDQGRVYIAGDQVVMIMIRRLPRGYLSKGSWLQITSPGVPVPQEMAGRTYLESARTAERDDIHALRLDINEDLFIEIGGRVDRETLHRFAEGIDYDSL